MTIDLHCHTRLSDGSLGIEDIILLASRSGVDTIAITDHDCQAGTVRGKIIGKRHNVEVVPGVELSSYSTELGKNISILCYLADNPNRLEGLCKKNSLARRKASQLMIVKACKRYPISSELVLKCASGSTNIYKQHIMNALIECGYTTHIYGELYNQLFDPESPDSIYVQPKFPEPKEVIDAIHEAGGVAIVSHPGNSGLIPYLDKLIEDGIDGFEVWTPGHSQEDIDKLLELAKKKKLLATGGSNFRGIYNREAHTIGSFTTPEDNYNAIVSYHAKLRRQRRKAEAQAAAELSAQAGSK